MTTMSVAEIRSIYLRTVSDCVLNLSSKNLHRFKFNQLLDAACTVYNEEKLLRLIEEGANIQFKNSVRGVNLLPSFVLVSFMISKNLLKDIVSRNFLIPLFALDTN
jgi:hypothetical protein